MHLRAARQAAEASVVADGTTSTTTAATTTASQIVVGGVSEGAAVVAAAEGSGGGGVLSTTASAAEAGSGAPGSDGGGSGNSSSLNVTAHFLDEEIDDYGFSEMQTVALACIATLIPLFFILVAAFAVRFVWRKFRARRLGEEAGDAGGGSRGYDGVLQRDESSEAAKAAAVGGGTTTSGSGAHLLLLMPDELKTSESQFSVTPGDDVTSQSPLIGGSSTKGSSTTSTFNHKGVGTSKSANGNVITMTLQNNHLIVETEELASLPMVDDGEPSPPPVAASPLEDTAQIHAPPPSVEFRRAAPEEDLLDDEDEEEVGGDLEGIAEEDEEEAAAEEAEEGRRRKGGKEDEESEEDEARGGGDEEGGQAGLSQSDLSESSSIGSSNPTYRYGNQLGYAAGHFGYPQYAGYEAPKVTSAAPAEDEGTKGGPEGGWMHDVVNGEAGGDEEEEEEERRHQRVQEQLGGADVPAYAPGHHRTASLPKATDDSAAMGVLGGGGVGIMMPDADKMRCSKRRSLPIITHAPSTALGGFRKLLNEEEEVEEGEERREGGGKEEKVGKSGKMGVGGTADVAVVGGGDVDLEVADKEAPQSRGRSDNAALSAVDVTTNSGEHENEAFVETD